MQQVQTEKERVVLIAEPLSPLFPEGYNSSDDENGSDHEEEEVRGQKAPEPPARPSMTMSFYNAATTAAGAVAGSLSPLFRSPVSSPRGGVFPVTQFSPNAFLAGSTALQEDKVLAVSPQAWHSDQEQLRETDASRDLTWTETEEEENRVLKADGQRFASKGHLTKKEQKKRMKKLSTQQMEWLKQLNPLYWKQVQTFLRLDGLRHASKATIGEQEVGWNWEDPANVAQAGCAMVSNQDRMGGLSPNRLGGLRGQAFGSEAHALHLKQGQTGHVANTEGADIFPEHFYETMGDNRYSPANRQAALTQATSPSAKANQRASAELDELFGEEFDEAKEQQGGEQLSMNRVESDDVADPDVYNESEQYQEVLELLDSLELQDKRKIVGKLQVEITQCRALPNVQNEWMGKQHPVVIAALGDQKRRTDYVWGGATDPVWKKEQNRRMQFTIYETEIGQEHKCVTLDSAEGSGGDCADADDKRTAIPTTTRNDASLTVEVWNKNTFQNTLIGSVVIDLSLIESLDGHSNWYELDTEGSLQCIISRYFTDAREEALHSALMWCEEDEEVDEFGAPIYDAHAASLYQMYE